VRHEWLPTTTALCRAWSHLTRLQIFGLMALHRWIPMLSRLLG